MNWDPCLSASATFIFVTRWLFPLGFLSTVFSIDSLPGTSTLHQPLLALPYLWPSQCTPLGKLFQNWVSSKQALRYDFSQVSIWILATFFTFHKPHKLYPLETLWCIPVFKTFDQNWLKQDVLIKKQTLVLKTFLSHYSKQFSYLK